MASHRSLQPPNNLDRYLVIHIATTCDEHGVYVTKDSAEVIEIGWVLADGKTLEKVTEDKILVKPVNTPITPLCTSLTTLTWEHVKHAGTFREAITRFDQFVQENLLQKNLEFAFVTLDAWDLRVQLPREARDKAVVLPPYLQHSRTFDLRTEYQHWQSHHPESLPFGSSSLTNICAALEVEPVQSSAPIKHNLPFHLQALAPANPRRALEEALTLHKVVKNLVAKSQPISDHPDVLTRPMDARADVRAFLQERSKVLHMSGLPHDTTQSELESWFTQYGGRPIAFWTLRTPDQHKPTGTGFAVFSSHEEAAESLCMNGRALSEKAIEVSPSSSRVLDRAADILTPFPPSKNRPRPGDWTCPSCGFSNFQRRTACFRCSYPLSQAMPPHDAMNYGYGYGGPPMMHHGGPHSHGVGGRAQTSLGASAPFRPGDWRCGVETCNYHNFAKNVNCLRCGAPRSQALIITDSTNYNAMNDPNNMGMPHQPQMAATPGGGPFGPAGYGAPGAFAPAPAGFAGPPPSGYGMPSHFAPPMGGYAASNGGMPTPHHHQAGPSGFDSRAETAFSQAGAGSVNHAHPAAGATHGGSSGVANYNGAGAQSYDQGPDPFHFLGTELGNMSLNADPRNSGGRQAGAGATKSPN